MDLIKRAKKNHQKKQKYSKKIKNKKKKKSNKIITKKGAGHTCACLMSLSMVLCGKCMTCGRTL